MPAILSVESFLKEISEGLPVILDVRSPKEYHHAHIPGAISFPLLNNEERKEVGITYKNDGREAAVTRGFELVGNKFADFIKSAKEIAPSKEVMIYCWRGGMRSNIMAWLLSLSGFKISVLKGGYKSFRHWVLDQFQVSKNILIVGGKTGSGKTELINALKEIGEQTIDIENLANHKGSAFGSLGQKEQPSTESFENFLAMEWSKADAEKILWMENESLLIGTCALPLGIFNQMRTAPVIEINLDYEIRKKRILSEYGIFDAKLLAEKTQKVKKRLGGLRLKEAMGFLDAGNLINWCDVMMDYYDRTYHQSNKQREQNNIYPFVLDHDQMQLNAVKVKEFFEKSIKFQVQSIKTSE
ncbi:MAG TPA: tRNA 2-selenouridine(34) synthase MnmH [Bacteroidia bacterium]|nr:tRNA 2-selenouridine(34) synthase MnmH [Bacteroidia bacterium]